jgi:hypothetical protein
MDASQKEAEAVRDDIKTNQTKTDAKPTSMDANMKSIQEELRTQGTKLEEAETNRMAEREALNERIARMDANQAELKGAIAHKKWEKPTSKDMAQEVPKEDAAVMPVGEPRNRHRKDRRNLAAGRRQKKEERNLDARRLRKQQKRIKSKDGCRKDLGAARRGTTFRAAMA